MQTASMADRQSIYQSDEYGNEKSGLNRLKQNPLLAFALVGFTTIASYKFYRIRADRKAGIQKRLSLQLIDTRLVAQGFVIGTLSLTVFYMLGKRIYCNLTGQKMESSDNRHRYD